MPATNGEFLVRTKQQHCLPHSPAREGEPLIGYILVMIVIGITSALWILNEDVG